jgi:Cys-rich protein (TIGR01571 family)
VLALPPLAAAEPWSSRELQTEISLENMRVTQASWFVNMMDTIVLPGLKLAVWLLTVVVCRKWFTEHEDQFATNERIAPSEIAQELESGAMVGQPRDQLCDCVNDCGSCVCAFYCYPCMMGQVYEKLIGPRGVCVKLMIVLGWLYVWTTLATSIWLSNLGAMVDQHKIDEGEWGKWYFLTETLNTVAKAIAFVVTFRILVRFRARYGISTASLFGTLVETFFCPWCILAQIARHIHNYAGTNTSVWCDLSPTGDGRDGEAWWLWDKTSWPYQARTVGPREMNPVGGTYVPASLDDFDTPQRF